MTGLAQVLFHRQANGSLIVQNGQVVGSELIGQNFSSDKYFQPRPSAAGESGYDAIASGGSNLGPTNKKLIDAVEQRADAYRKLNGLGPSDPVPGDAVTASASGLDPHISPANAALQAARVARARRLPEQQVRDLVARYTEGPQWFLFGEPRVNVLMLNLALDGAG
jgi:K+-transporting ATPase ATPase C chain